MISCGAAVRSSAGALPSNLCQQISQQIAQQSPAGDVGNDIGDDTALFLYYPVLIGLPVGITLTNHNVIVDLALTLPSAFNRTLSYSVVPWGLYPSSPISNQPLNTPVQQRQAYHERLENLGTAKGTVTGVANFISPYDMSPFDLAIANCAFGIAGLNVINVTNSPYYIDNNPSIQNSEAGKPKDLDLD